MEDITHSTAPEGSTVISPPQVNSVDSKTPTDQAVQQPQVEQQAEGQSQSQPLSGDQHQQDTNVKDDAGMNLR